MGKVDKSFKMADQEADFSFQEPQPNDDFHPIWDKKKDFILTLQ